MWQRFTERARRVILLGQEEAGKMSSGHVGTEHLLLGLVRENEGVAAQVLQKMGVSLGKVRQEIEAEVQPGADPGSAEPKLTPKAKRVLELAADEARRMRHNYIGTEHLLLALLREKDGLAATVLRRLGLNLEKARAQVMEYLGPDAPGSNQTPSSQSGASGRGTKFFMVASTSNCKWFSPPRRTPEHCPQTAWQKDAFAGFRAHRKLAKGLVTLLFRPFAMRSLRTGEVMPTDKWIAYIAHATNFLFISNRRTPATKVTTDINKRGPYMSSKPETKVSENFGDAGAKT